MTRWPGEVDGVEQIRYGCGDPNLLGQQGYGPTQASPGVRRAAVLSTWDEVLRPHVRIGDRAGRRPDASLVYWTDGEWAALLRRTQGGVSGDCLGSGHALVAPAALLPVRRALLLHP